MIRNIWISIVLCLVTYAVMITVHYGMYTRGSFFVLLAIFTLQYSAYIKREEVMKSENIKKEVEKADKGEK